jgi:hypothetical protein
MEGEIKEDRNPGARMGWTAIAWLSGSGIGRTVLKTGSHGEIFMFVEHIFEKKKSIEFINPVRSSVRPSGRLSVFPFVRLSVRPSVRSSVCPFVRLSDRPSVRPSVPYFFAIFQPTNSSNFWFLEKTIYLRGVRLGFSIQSPGAPGLSSD